MTFILNITLLIAMLCVMIASEHMRPGIMRTVVELFGAACFAVLLAVLAAASL